MAFKSDPGQCSCGNICNRLEKRGPVSVFYSNINKIFLGTDGAASSRVGQILPLQVEGSIPYSAPLRTIFNPITSRHVRDNFGCHEVNIMASFSVPWVT